jgi:hypothetical protein
MVEISGAIAGLKGEMVELVAPSAEFGVASSELNRIHVVGIEFSCGLAGESGLVFYCIAVGDGAQNLFP